MWTKENLLDPLIKRIKELSRVTRSEAENKQMIKIYGDFPEKKDSDFIYPRHVEENVAWAVIRLGGRERVVGYIIENTFYVVFLDKNHRFWISKKKHT